MADTTEIKVPDIGDFDAVEVIEVLVSPGDTVQAEDSLISIESDKASMEIPSPGAGTIKEVAVKVGDKVSQGDVIAKMEPAGEQQAGDDESQAGDKDTAPASEEKPDRAEKAPAEEKPAPAAAPKGGSETQTVKVPDIGDDSDVPIVEILVKAGDSVAEEDPLVTLESDKASMEIPAPAAGTIKELRVSVGDKVSAGSELLVMETEAGSESEQPTAAEPAKQDKPQAESTPESKPQAPAAETAGPREAPLPPVDESGFSKAHASPAVRKFARELGADLSQIEGSGRKGRILKEDVQAFVKQALSGAAAPGAGAGAPAGVTPPPQVDFAAYGEIETQPLSKINKLTGQNLHSSWFHIPHVTQFEDADITEMEAFRKQLSAEYKEKGIKITPIAFLIKAVVAALKEFPRFNASLEPGGENLILKKYFHIGVAVDTPDGLVVPVIRDADRKGIVELAEAIVDAASRARDKKLKPDEMKGGCFTISSLGGVGGTAFTPIINQPEVAILGASRSVTKPVYVDGEFQPRLMLPLSLSYDHRVIDGAAAARFTTYLSTVLSDMRRLLL